MMLFRPLLCLMAIAIAGSFFTACEEEPPASLYDPGHVSGPTPTIGSVAPNDSALAGVTTIVITGTNFSTIPANNLVFFDASLATVLQATTTQLAVRAPVLIKETIIIKVSVQGSELFSNVVLYKLTAAVALFGQTSTSTDQPIGVAAENNGDVYVSFLPSPSGPTVARIFANGVRDGVVYGQAISSAARAHTGLKIGPGGYLYGVANQPFIFRVPPGGGPTVRWFARAGFTNRFADIDFDQNQNIWCGGTGTLNRIRLSDSNLVSFPFSANVRTVRVFVGPGNSQQYLYVGGQILPDSVERIVRFPIVSPDSLGPLELYFDFSSAFALAQVYALTFAEDGDMFVGTDSSAGSIVLIHPDKTHERFYPGLLTERIIAFAYGKDTELFVSRSSDADAQKKLLKVMTQKRGARYYGRQ